MTQNNERELIEQLAKEHGHVMQSGCIIFDANENLEAFAKAYKVAIDANDKSPISQNEQQPKQIPDGWKLVPIEPTYEMLSAVLNNTEYAGDNESLMTTAYKAMINASPTNTEVGE